MNYIITNNQFENCSSTEGYITIAQNRYSFGKVHYAVNTNTHKLENEICINCNHKFILVNSFINDKLCIYTYDESIKDLNCNEVIMKDVIR